MTEEVFVSIKGTHMRNQDNEDVELIVPAKYSSSEGVDRIEYEEQVEGFRQSIMNTISVDTSGMRIVKKGFTNSDMSFYKNGKKAMTFYNTPFGEVVMSIFTKNIDIERSADRLKVSVDYVLDIGDDYMSDCNIMVDVFSKEHIDLGA